MIMNKPLVAIATITIIAVVVMSCSDMGEELPSVFAASVVNVVVGPGQQVTVEITGGVVPYVITQEPDSALASAQLVNPGSSPASLVISVPVTVVTGGTTQVKIGDSHSDNVAAGTLLHDDEITITITVTLTPPLTANPPQVTVGPGQSVNVSIGNGSPPYIIAALPNPGLATASFVDGNVNPATLVITGVTIASAAGSTSVRVTDSSSPQREVTVPITKNP